MTSLPADDKAWRALLAPYKKASWGPAWIQLANSALPFVLIWAGMAFAVQRGAWWVALLLALPASFFFIRLFIIQHDCGHGSFFPTRGVNNLLGGVLGVVTLFPYGYWKKTHAIHHATSGNLDDREFGDIVTLTVREYRERSRLGRLGYRLYRNPFVMFVIGPTFQFVLKHRFPFDIPFSWKREWQSVLKTNLALAAVGTALVLGLGWRTVLMVQLPIVVVAGALGVWLFYVQHQFEDTYWEHADEWDFYRAGAHGSSFYDLGRIGHWLTGNIGYHHIHHLASQIPNYRLASCFAENPALQRVTRLTIRDSLRCAKLRLWDEERKTMITFRELGRAPAPAAVASETATAG